MSVEATRLLAYRQLYAMLKAGLTVAEATERVASAISSGRVKTAMALAHRRIDGGADAGPELANSLPPELAVLLQECDDESLVSRLETVVEHLGRLHRLTARIRAVGGYPIRVALGALLILLSFMTYMALLRSGRDVSSVAGRTPFIANLPFFSGAICGLLVYMIATAVRSHVHGKLAPWSRLLPGGRVEQLTWLCHFLSVFSLMRDPRFGAYSAAEALRRAAAVVPEPTFRRRLEEASAAVNGGIALPRALRTAGLPANNAVVLGLGERAGRPSQAAARAADQLEQQAARSGKVFIQALGIALLAAAGLAVLMLVLYMMGDVRLGGQWSGV